MFARTVPKRMEAQLGRESVGCTLRASSVKTPRSRSSRKRGAWPASSAACRDGMDKPSRPTMTACSASPKPLLADIGKAIFMRAAAGLLVQTRAREVAEGGVQLAAGCDLEQRGSIIAGHTPRRAGQVDTVDGLFRAETGERPTSLLAGI